MKTVRISIQLDVFDTTSEADAVARARDMLLRYLAGATPLVWELDEKTVDEAGEAAPEPSKTPW